MTYTPQPHQEDAVRRLVAMQGRAVLADDMGLGKSATALWTMQHFRCEPTIIVCPKTIGSKWCDEVEQAVGARAALLQTRKHVETLTTSPRYIVLHYDLLARLNEVHLQILIDEGRPAGLILDEAHYVKNRISQRSKAAAKLAARCDHVLCLTGTLVRNTVQDVWHPVHLARPYHLENYARFEARYCDMRVLQLPIRGKVRRIRQYNGSRNEGQLKARLAEVMVRRRKEDVLDLPPLTRVVVPVDLDEETRKAYDRVRRQALAEVRAMVTDEEGGRSETSVLIRARSVLEQTIRLEQVAMGMVRGEGDHDGWMPQSAKYRWVVDTVLEILAEGRSVVVFAKFNAFLVALRNELIAEMEVDMTWLLTGDVTQDHRTTRIEAFKGLGGVLLCQVKLAEGFDLVTCTDAIFVGTDWTPAVTQQAEARLHRMGQAGTVTCYYPLARRTIDEHLHDVVVRKAKDAARVEPTEVLRWLEP